jgi:hypothetical protein
MASAIALLPSRSSRFYLRSSNAPAPDFFPGGFSPHPTIVKLCRFRSGVRGGIAERIWPAWREQGTWFDEPTVLSLFPPAGDYATAGGYALRESVPEIQDASRAEAERTGDPDPPFTGEWATVRISDAVLEQVVRATRLRR